MANNELQLNGGEGRLAVVPQLQGQEAPHSWLPARPASLSEALAIAKVVADSDLAPKDFRGKPANVLVAFQLGAELGLSPMQALQNIAVINGRPSIWGDAVLALVRASGLLEEFTETDDGETATCTVQRKGEKHPQSTSFSMKDAATAGLANKDLWKQYPKRMRQMRARGFRLRDSFTDVLKGVVSAEEAMDIETTATDVPPMPTTAALPAEPKKTTTEKLKEQLGAQSPVSQSDTEVLTPDDLSSILTLQKECDVADEEFKHYLEGTFNIKTRKAITRGMLADVKEWLRAEGARRWKEYIADARVTKGTGITEEDYLLYLLKVMRVEQEAALTPDQRNMVLRAIETGDMEQWLLSQK